MTDFTSATGVNAMVDELRQRGVEFPLGGFAPGKYSVVCRSCARRFGGGKRAYQCLPCALKARIGASTDVVAARKDGEREGYRQAQHINAILDALEGFSDPEVPSR